MAKLRKYQIDAIVSEIRSKLDEIEHPKRNESEYIQRYNSLLTEANRIHLRIEEKKEEIERIKSEKVNLKESYEDVVGRRYPYSYPDEQSVVNHVEDVVDEEFDIKDPSRHEIERAVIISDLNDSDDIINTVMEKLGFNE